MKNTSASKQANKTNVLRKSTENLPPFAPSTEKDKETSKLAHLEINLNRVCLQQDALMPLLQMIEYIPAIQRTDSVVKGLMRKIEENEQKILKSEKLLESKIKNPDGNQDKDTKKQQKQLQELQGKVKDMEQQMNNLQRWYEAKLKEENQALQRNLEHKIEKSKNDTQKSVGSEKRVNTEQSKTHSKQVSQVQPQQTQESQQQYQYNVLQAVEQMVTASLNQVRNQIQSEINELREQVIASKQ
ncbi:unnamed protein product [Paramecium sonneborni]|uniref:Uncharacterized protein n=1 Tax=Paramecium sonneborni TaxID=65129 RepID=A0A8S1PXV7_9CILI|nr:unnamed protein product [Paramecium sonneborni]